MGVKKAHWYHVYASGNWKYIYDLHATALRDGGLAEELGDQLYLGIVGTEEERQECKEHVAASGLPFTVVAEQDLGWEQVTQNALYNHISSFEEESYVLYSHTKGATYGEGEVNSSNWRAAMTYWNVVRWKTVEEYLDNGCQLAGCHWQKGAPLQPSYFAGTFWWAKASTLRAIPPPRQDSRWDAETWIGVAPWILPGLQLVDLFPTGPGAAPTADAISQIPPVIKFP